LSAFPLDAKHLLPLSLAQLFVILLGAIAAAAAAPQVFLAPYAKAVVAVQPNCRIEKIPINNLACK